MDSFLVQRIAYTAKQWTPAKVTAFGAVPTILDTPKPDFNPRRAKRVVREHSVRECDGFVWCGVCSEYKPAT